MSKIKRIREKETKKLKSRSPDFGFRPPEIKPTDFFLGSKKLGSVVINPQGDWRLYAPLFEPQSKAIETQSCVSFGTLSALEMICKLQYGFEPNFSDRFLSVMSGTNPYQGNTPSKVSDTVRHSGTIPESWLPFVDDIGEYFKPVPQECKDLGLKWLEEWEFGYEWCSDLKEGLKRSPVGVAVSAWTINEKGEYIRTGASNHWCVLIGFSGANPLVWDSYEDKVKVLSPDHTLEYAQIYTLKKKQKKGNPDYESGNHYLTLIGEVCKFFKDMWNKLLGYFYSYGQ